MIYHWLVNDFCFTPFDILKNFTLARFRYMTKFSDAKKSVRHCRDYADQMDELKVVYPHRNFEVLFIALNTCLWRVADKHWRRGMEEEDV
jgi:hypothetical protein